MNHARPSRRPTGRHAFTLLEALVASVILGASVLAVISAMSTAQKLAMEGQKRVLAAMAANDLLIELSTLEYGALRTHPPINHGVGHMESLDGTGYPASFWAIGRSMTATETTITDAASGSVIRGTRVVVDVVDEDKTLCSIEAFFAEPRSGGGA